MIRTDRKSSRRFEWPAISIRAAILFSLLFVSNASAAGLNLFVSLPPEAEFVKQVAGDKVTVEILVAPGQAPETFEPTPKQLARLSSADIYFRIGMPFETRLVEKISQFGGNIKFIDLRAGINLRKSDTDHDGHGHGLSDPHIWMDPVLVQTIAGNIASGLKMADPENTAFYDQNLAHFKARLDSLTASIKKELKPYQGRSFFIFHPVLGYFADRFGLKQVAIEVDGKEPGAKQLAGLIDRAKKENIGVIFVQPQYSPKTARAVADAIGGRLVEVDPLAEDYIPNLEKIVNDLIEGLK